MDWKLLIPLSLPVAAVGLVYFLHWIDPTARSCREIADDIRARGPSYTIELFQNVETGQIIASVRQPMRLFEGNGLAGTGKAIQIGPSGQEPARYVDR